jgi:hypothetical protein
MGYNKFKWWRQGPKKRPLSQTAHIFDKIQNGDFDLSEFFVQAFDARKKANRAYEHAYKKYGGDSNSDRLEIARDASRMDRVRALKLEFEGELDEMRILNSLRNELQKKFGIDVWNEMMNEKPMDLEELYNYYYQKSLELKK